MSTMIRTMFLFLLVFSVSNAVLAAPEPIQNHEAGIGIVLGEPSGLNGQFFWSSKAAIDVTAAWSWSDWFMTTADFQIYNYILDSPREWSWYYGIGAYTALPKNDHGTFGIRLPLGLRYHIPHSIVDVWGEADPALRLISDTQADLQGGIGVTFWVK